MFWKRSKREEHLPEMTFLDHLESLRWHIIKSFVAIGVFGIIAFIFKDFVFDQVILAPKNPTFFTNSMFCALGKWMDIKSLCINQRQLQIVNLNLAGQFSTHIMVSAFAGFIVAFPYILFEFWRFLKPALYQSERKAARGGIFFISLLFFMGALFGYYIIVPISVEFFGGYFVSSEVLNQINLDSYVTSVASTVLACGIVFELPILIYFLSKIGLITPSFLKKYRRHSIVIILAVAAVITPPDVFSQLIVSIPLLILYESGVIISSRVQKAKLKLERRANLANK